MLRATLPSYLHHLARERPGRVVPSDQGLSNDGPDWTRDSHLEESDNIHLASSFPDSSKGLKGRVTES